MMLMINLMVIMMRMIIDQGFGPEVLVFEVLGQIHLRFWLVDRYLVLRWHLYHFVIFNVKRNHIYKQRTVSVGVALQKETGIFRYSLSWFGNHRHNVDIFSFQFLLTHRPFPGDGRSSIFAIQRLKTFTLKLT